MDIGYTREIEYISIVIDDHEYQVPGEIARAIKTLKADLDQEKNNHAKTKHKLATCRNDDFEIMTSRIMYNLSYDNPKRIKHQNAFKLNTGETETNYKPGGKCLAYSLDDFEYEKGDTTFTFRDECKKRIMLALQGKTVNGLDFKDAK